MNKSKTSNEYLATRLTPKNVNDYLEKVFDKNIEIVKEKAIAIKPFLQDNYGKKGDCTLTSILTVVNFYKPNLNDQVAYNYIEKIANKYLYNGDVYGTFPVFNKTILNEVFKYFNINRKITSKYFKGVGFNYNTIIKLIDKNTPVMISITRDGRNYYHNHTITIVGYRIYENKQGKQRIMFKVYDN